MDVQFPTRLGCSAVFLAQRNLFQSDANHSLFSTMWIKHDPPDQPKICFLPVSSTRHQVFETISLRFFTHSQLTQRIKWANQNAIQILAADTKRGKTFSSKSWFAQLLTLFGKNAPCCWSQSRSQWNRSTNNSCSTVALVVSFFVFIFFVQFVNWWSAWN